MMDFSEGQEGEIPVLQKKRRIYGDLLSDRKLLKHFWNNGKSYTLGVAKIIKKV
jgi:hypothetical protein